MGCEACCIWSLITLVAGEVENKSSSECLGASEVERAKILRGKMEWYGAHDTAASIRPKRNIC
jgi:hypothetical protein